jgi:hypothetical protein
MPAPWEERVGERSRMWIVGRMEEGSDKRGMDTRREESDPPAMRIVLGV